MYLKKIVRIYLTITYILEILHYVQDDVQCLWEELAKFVLNTYEFPKVVSISAEKTNIKTIIK